MSTRKRREPGIDQLPSGRWRVRVTGPDGIVRTVTPRSGARSFASFEEAKKARDVERAAVATGTWRDPQTGSETVGEYLERWLTRRTGEARPGTLARYRDLAGRYLLAPVPLGRRTITLGDVPLNALTPMMVADWHGAVRAYARSRIVERAARRAAARTLTDNAAARAWAAAQGYTSPRTGRPVNPTTGRVSPVILAAWRDAGSPKPPTSPEPVAEDAGASTAAHAYRLLRALMHAAVADELVPRNPCKVKGAAKDDAAEREPATPAQVAAAAAAMPDRWAALVEVTAWGYLRRGEGLGLQRRDVTIRRDDDGTITGARLRLERAVVTVDGRPTVGPLKTPTSYRTVPLPGSVARRLAAHMERFTGPAADAHLFTSETGTLVDGDNLGRAWSRARAAAGRPDLHWHDLRHTGATEARRAGADLNELMRLLGHADLASVARYQHVDVDDLDLVAAALDARLALA